MCVRMPRGSGTTCLQERQTRFSIMYLLARAASCKDFGILVIDISVAFVHARTDVLSGGSTVEQSWSHLDEQAEYAGKRCRDDHKTCAMRSSRQVGRNDGLLIHR